MRTVWLASYPKSGNTWMRLLLSALMSGEAAELDINRSIMRGGIASDRFPFDYLTMLDSGLLSFDEIDAVRPRLYRELASQRRAFVDAEEGGLEGVHYVKTHDAYTRTATGEPMLGGPDAATGAVLIVRDPRDIASSLANHNGSSIGEAISFLCDSQASFASRLDRQHTQFRQILGSWSDFNATWLDQADVPVLLVRYEAMLEDTARELSRVLAFAGVSAEPARVAAAVSAAQFEKVQAQERERGFKEASTRAFDQGFFRQGRHGLWRVELEAGQVVQIEQAHAAMMRRVGYEPSTGASEG